MRRHREALHAKKGDGTAFRIALAAWAWFARRPRAYHLAARFMVAILGSLGRRRGRFRWLPFASGWTRHRDLPSPQGRTFQQLWAERQAGVQHDK
jgi:L-lactate dehydrogenase complex protein LldF